MLVTTRLTVATGIAVLMCGPFAGSAAATLTSAATGCTSVQIAPTVIDKCTGATMTGDGGSDSIFIVPASENTPSPTRVILEHNTSIGIADEKDFDTTVAGRQELLNANPNLLTINAGAGVDGLTVNGRSAQINNNITYNGEAPAGANPSQIEGDDSAHSVTLSGNQVTGLLGGAISVTPGSVGDLAIFGGSADDSFDVTNALSENQVELYGEGGNDTFKVKDGATTGTSGRFEGSPGTDTIDYSNRTTAVTVNLATQAVFHADLDSSQAVPSTTRHVETSVQVFFPDLSTTDADYSVQPVFDSDTLANVPAADITSSGIFSGAPGSTGPKLFDSGPASSWSDPLNPSDLISPITPADPDITEPALRAGNTYAELDTGPGQPLTRGQLVLDPETGYFGPATAANTLHGALTDENVIGGSAGDTITGSPIDNNLQGGGGTDTIRGKEGNDDITGGTASDAMFGDAGDDVLRANDSAADTTLDCGAGLDYAMVDGGDPATTGCEGTNKLPSPTSLATVPASPADNTAPHVTGNAFAGSTVDVYTSPSCTTGHLASGVATSSGTFDVPVTVADGSTTSLYASSSGSDPTSNCSSVVTYKELAPETPDTTAPVPQIGKHPKKKTKSTKAAFTFSSDDPQAGFKCALDKAALAPCTSPKKLRKLKPKKHRFTFEATDAAGNISPPTVFSWKVLKKRSGS
ncbi:MAG: hypothetical protein QOG62_2780 [Thermoleophilaceae bacterium]|nr:hypothetical protein [Thermoleophilaceae bacterium]